MWDDCEDELRCETFDAAARLKIRSLTFDHFYYPANGFEDILSTMPQRFSPIPLIHLSIRFVPDLFKDLAMDPLTACKRLGQKLAEFIPTLMVLELEVLDADDDEERVVQWWRIERREEVPRLEEIWSEVGEAAVQLIQRKAFKLQALEVEVMWRSSARWECDKRVSFHYIFQCAMWRGGFSKQHAMDVLDHLWAHRESTSGWPIESHEDVLAPWLYWLSFTPEKLATCSPALRTMLANHVGSYTMGSGQAWSDRMMSLRAWQDGATDGHTLAVHARLENSPFSATAHPLFLTSPLPFREPSDAMDELNAYRAHSFLDAYAIKHTGRARGGRCKVDMWREEENAEVQAWKAEILARRAVEGDEDENTDLDVELDGNDDNRHSDHHHDHEMDDTQGGAAHIDRVHRQVQDGLDTDIEELIDAVSSKDDEEHKPEDAPSRARARQTRTWTSGGRALRSKTSSSPARLLLCHICQNELNRRVLAATLSACACASSARASATAVARDVHKREREHLQARAHRMPS
ncbi:uncharacterized protein BXZ73DRAFT_75465 [Epithele typhae]|uniref:uncharacterized protein n=1 Tax=Epithele typhae TaxID=378194 RepID=UPI0020078F27|nr:uncharacterized protein BXZ73DRAFT_75465 [Epithele typhae]KAH9940951.1 hypothetical protein BXZ73DRAFT_75465 [Epithele typhae]